LGEFSHIEYFSGSRRERAESFERHSPGPGASLGLHATFDRAHSVRMLTFGRSQVQMRGSSRRGSDPSDLC
jgi:hypothetical protein